jgi:hypothetical protein
VSAGFETIRNNLFKYNNDAHFGGIRIQAMAADGYDMFVGGKNDPSFGPVVYFGMGGIYVEVFKDIANMLCPALNESVHKRFDRLKASEILSGLRGRSPGDMSMLLSTLW